MKSILISSNEAWGDIWFSKHHYANELASLGYKVYFINPPNKWHIWHLFSFKIKIRKARKNLCVVNYNNNFPVKLFPRYFTKLTDWLNKSKINKFLAEKPNLWWKFDPNRFLNTGKTKSIYHVADPYMHLWQDKIHAKHADLIVCTSPKYISYYKKLGYKTVFVPHGVSKDEFRVDTEKVKNIKSKYGKFALIIGTINTDYDINLLSFIASNEIKIVIIGSETNRSNLWTELKKNSKVNYIGIKHSKQLKNYILASSICLNPYKFNLKKTIGSGSPLKILNYLAQYKVIVSSIDTEVNELEGCVIYSVKTKEDFMEKVKLGLSNRLYVDKVKVKDYLDKQTYPKLIDNILKEISE